jgi:hypothetical protein
MENLLLQKLKKDIEVMLLKEIEMTEVNYENLIQKLKGEIKRL